MRTARHEIAALFFENQHAIERAIGHRQISSREKRDAIGGPHRLLAGIFDRRRCEIALSEHQVRALHRAGRLAERSGKPEDSAVSEIGDV